jgi:hypothetical protein
MNYAPLLFTNLAQVIVYPFFKETEGALTDSLEKDK